MEDVIQHIGYNKFLEPCHFSLIWEAVMLFFHKRRQNVKRYPSGEPFPQRY